MTESEKKERARAIVTKGNADLEVAAGETPKGLFTFLRVEEEDEFGGNPWIPVVFKNDEDGQEYSFSLSTLTKSTDLMYSVGRNVGKRCDWWYDGAVSGTTTIEYLGSEPNVKYTSRKEVKLNGKLYRKGDEVPAGTFKIKRFHKQTLG